MKRIIEAGAGIFATANLEIINSAGREILNYAADRLGPLLATASPGGAELHHQNVALKGVERVVLFENALDMELRRRLSHQPASAALGVGGPNRKP